MRQMLCGLLLLMSIVSGCAWTMSRDRSKRISDCLARCESMGPGPAAPGTQNARDPSFGLRDSRSECERACHSRN